MSLDHHPREQGFATYKQQEAGQQFKRHMGLKPLEMRITTAPIQSKFPASVQNKQSIFPKSSSVVGSRIHTPIEHKLIENKILRKKKRSLRDAMDL